MKTKCIFTLLTLTFLAAPLVASGDSISHPSLKSFTPKKLSEMAKEAKRLGLPEGVVKESECVPGMGEHWVKPADFPEGPIYGVYQNKLVFIELMPSQAAFAEGKSWKEVLHPPVGKNIDHVDIDYMPHGHQGYEVPHYDIHAYFVPHASHMAFCPPK